MRPSVAGYWSRTPKTSCEVDRAPRSPTRTSMPRAPARVWTTAMVCGWQSAATKKTLRRRSVTATAHVHGLGRGGRLVEQRGVGDRQAGQVGDHGLEVEQRLEPALGDLRLVGRVLGVPARVLQDVALDHRRAPGSRGSPCRGRSGRPGCSTAMPRRTASVSRSPSGRSSGSSESEKRPRRRIDAGTVSPTSRSSESSAERVEHLADLGLVRARGGGGRRCRSARGAAGMAPADLARFGARARPGRRLAARYASPLFTYSSYCSAFISA